MPDLLKLSRLYSSDLPVYLIQYVTSRCNARCGTCFYAHELNTKTKDQELDLDEIRKIAGSFNKLWQVTLAGGEPFLRADLPEICEIFSKMNDARTVTIPTNGLQPAVTEKMAGEFLSRCPGTFFRISLSIDNIGEKHDRQRGVPGNFDKVVETHSRLKNLMGRFDNFNIDVNTCLSKANEGDIEEIIRWVHENLEVNNHDVSYIRGRAKDPTLKNASPEKYARALALIQKTRKPENRPLSRVYRALVDQGRKSTLNTLQNRGCTSPCKTIRKMIVISEIGDVFGCEILWNKLGNLRDHGHDIRRVLAQDIAREEYRKLRAATCHCTWECANNLNAVYDPRQFVPIAKNVLLNR